MLGGSRYVEPHMTPLRSALSALLILSLAVTAPGCLAGLSSQQREQCRQLRGRAAGRAVGGVLASVVVLGVLVIAAAATGGSPNFGNIGRPARRRANREARLAACREPDPNSPSDPGFVVDLQPAVPVLGADSPADVPLLPEPSGPPSVAELDEAIVQQYSDLLACGLQPERLLYLDARIKGHDGSVTGVVLGGEGSFGMSVSCVSNALSDMRFRPFDGVVDVRWAVQLDAAAP